jgi:hypothetical protein
MLGPRIPGVLELHMEVDDESLRLQGRVPEIRLDVPS